ncbi:MAG: ABC transporter ATP-binding protein [Alphaproteobacteria bacterium]|nr:ABC transporter ATP-binding protein [Alphaproteobacteria bacterium]MCB9974856.1 ABC transporter ATP-binding protein [Rhodospirillales bacterium]
MNALDISELCVAFKDNTVLDKVKLEVRRGETFGLMGLNGAGKTTMIKCILGLRDPDSGNITLDGQARDSAESKTKLAYLPEKFEPPWFLTGMEFIRFCLSLYGKALSEDEILRSTESLALDPRALKRRMHTYSKGMRQKLGILGTLLTGCSLLILDEPMSGLDPRARALVKKMITEMKHQDRTIFLSSHILADMDEICDRVAILHDSRIRFIGTPQEMKRRSSAQNLEQAFLEYIEDRVAA